MMQFLALFGLQEGRYRLEITDRFIRIETDDGAEAAGMDRTMPAPFANLPDRDQHWTARGPHGMVVQIGTWVIELPDHPARPE